MHFKYFGDSYDILKQSFVRWLSSKGAWVIDPMFSDSVSAKEAKSFSAFIGAPLVTKTVLTKEIDRSQYFKYPPSTQNLFLDPDTGISISISGTMPKYIYGNELIEIISARPHYLTMVFDQSIQRGKAIDNSTEKLKFFRSKEMFGFTYVAQTCLVVLSKDKKLVERSYGELLTKSKLPEERFVKMIA